MIRAPLVTPGVFRLVQDPFIDAESGKNVRQLVKTTLFTRRGNFGLECSIYY